MIAALGAFTSTVVDPDFWWHLRVGEWMAQNHRLPSHDLFTYTVSGHAWTDHEYLTEVLIWLGYNHGGLAAISVAFGIVTWLGFYAVFRTCRPRQHPYVIVGLGLALAVLAAYPIWGPRAQMLEFAFSALLLYWLDGCLAGRSRAITWFPLVMVLWANTHASFVIAFVFLGLAIASEGVHLLLDRSSTAHRARLLRLALVFAGSVVAMLATPHGPGFVLYPLATQASGAQQLLIQEWASPDFHLLSLRAFEAMAMLLMVGFAVGRPTLYQLLLSLVGLGLALESQRHIALFVAACTPVLVACWSKGWRELSARRGWRLGGAVVPGRMAALTVIVLMLIGAATAIRTVTNLRGQGQATAANFPVGAAGWLAAHPGVGRRMFNQYGWGGYLIDRFYPQPDRRVFIFGEAELMGDRLLYRYQAVQTLAPNWRSLLDAYRVDLVVFNRGTALSDVLLTQPGWRLAYQDRQADIFVRRPGARQ